MFILQVNVELTASRPGNERVIWPAGAAGQPHAETVTVTLTQQPGEGELLALPPRV